MLFVHSSSVGATCILLEKGIFSSLINIMYINVIAAPNVATSSNIFVYLRLLKRSRFAD